MTLYQVINGTLIPFILYELEGLVSKNLKFLELGNNINISLIRLNN